MNTTQNPTDIATLTHEIDQIEAQHGNVSLYLDPHAGGIAWTIEGVEWTSDDPIPSGPVGPNHDVWMALDDDTLDVDPDADHRTRYRAAADHIETVVLPALAGHGYRIHPS